MARKTARILIAFFTLLFGLTLTAGIPERVAGALNEDSGLPVASMMQTYTNDYGDAPVSYGSADHTITTLPIFAHKG